MIFSAFLLVNMFLCVFFFFGKQWLCLPCKLYHAQIASQASFIVFPSTDFHFTYKMSDEEHVPAEGALARPQPPPQGVKAHFRFHIDLHPTFSGDGSDPLHSCIQRYEVALAVSTTPLDKVKFLSAKLSGPAFSYWQTLSPEIQNHYASVKASLMAVFNRLPFIATFQTYLNAHPPNPSWFMLLN